jgi:peptidoglycan/LPS O-acetylase OafA/YrhL
LGSFPGRKQEGWDMNSSLNYRADIDGLRALAVMSVLVFHLDPNLMSAGFAGVDVFFVISGFLLTKIQISEVESERFSYIKFYLRRIKRILPVATVVIFITLIAGSFILLPEDLSDLSESALASQLFGANVYFTYFFETSYFNDATKMQPLLHYWSLGVEEQFYLVWPTLLMLLLAIGPKKRTLLLSALILLLLLLSEYMVRHEPKFAYYMSPSRAWQLLSGGLVCMILARYKDWTTGPRKPVLANFVGLFGVILLAHGLLFSQADRFPGFEALSVTLGTGLLIFAGALHETPIHIALSFRPVVWIGKLSFSLYLWHWPVFTYWRYAFGEIGPWSALFTVTLVFALSALTYFLIEKPFRYNSLRFGRAFATYFALPSLLIGACLLFTKSTNGYAQYAWSASYKANLRAAESQELQAGSKLPFICGISTLNSSVHESLLSQPNCYINGDGTQPDYLLWGDSHAAHYLGALGGVAKYAGFSFNNVAHWACPPLIGDLTEIVPPARLDNCERSVQVVADNLDGYDVIFLAASWRGRSDKRLEKVLSRLATTLEWLEARDKMVFVFGLRPSAYGLGKDCGAKRVKLPLISCSELAFRDNSGTAELNAQIKSVTERFSSAHYLDIDEAFCEGNKCSPYLDGQFSYFDSSHISFDGSVRAGEKIVKNLDEESAWTKLLELQQFPSEKTPPLPWIKSAENPELKQFANGIQHENTVLEFTLNPSAWGARNLDVKVDDGLTVLKDTKKNKASRYFANLLEASDLKATEQGTVFLKLSGVEADGPFFVRVMIENESDGSTRYHNFTADPVLDFQGTMASATEDELLAERTGMSANIYMRVPLKRDDMRISINLHPSTGSERYRHQKSSVGQLSFSGLSGVLVSSD